MAEKSYVWSFMLSKSLLRMVDIFGNYTSPLWGNSLLPTPAPSPSFLDGWDLLQAVSCLLSWNHLWGALSKWARPIIAGHRPTSVQTVCRESTLTINPACHLACMHRWLQEHCPFHIQTNGITSDGYEIWPVSTRGEPKHSPWMGKNWGGKQRNV